MVLSGEANPKGGRLDAALEKALGGGIPTRFYEGALARLTQLLPQAEKLAVVTADEKGNLEARAVKHMDVNLASETSPDLLRRTLRRNKAALLLDALQDQSYSHHPEVLKHKLRSVVCVPFGDDGTHRGLLYADNRTQPAAFTYDDLHAVQKLADQVGSGALPSAAPEPVQAENLPVHPPVPWIPISTLIFALVVIVSLMVPPISSVEQQARSESSVEVEPPDLTQRPFGVAQAFLEHLRKAEVEAARPLLSRSAQLNYNLESLHRSWTDLEGPAAQAVRRPLRESVSGNRAAVTVGLSGDPHAPMWTWRFVREGDTWRLDSLEGP